VSVDDAAALRSQLWRFRRAVALPDQAGDYPQDMLGCAESWPLGLSLEIRQPLPPWPPRLFQLDLEPYQLAVGLNPLQFGGMAARARTDSVGIPLAVTAR
jgi:hypothetical protein